MINDLAARLKQHAAQSGIDMIGITSAKPLFRGATPIDPRELLSDAKAVIIAGYYMKMDEDSARSPAGGPFGRFSAAYNVRAFTPMEKHYSGIIRRFLKKEGYKAVLNRNYRIPDKPAAVRAGLGKYGKNSVVMTKTYGSCVMFVTLVTDAPLKYDEFPLDRTDCGNCDLCLRSCPTQAIEAPFKVNRRLCITNWLWGVFVPAGLREKQGNRLFGCGDCIRVCPKNKKLKPRREYPVPMDKGQDHPELIPLIKADRTHLKDVVGSFPLRAGAEAIRGNAVIALGNAGDGSAVDALGWALNKGKPQIRSYAAWALGRIGGAKAGEFLRKALSSERKPKVVKEIERALNEGGKSA